MSCHKQIGYNNDTDAKAQQEMHMKTVIVGGGFGGVKAALELAKDSNHHITLVSKDDCFQYYPSLFSTATGHSHKESWVPLTTIFATLPNVTLVHDTITTLQPDTHTVVGEAGSYSYKNLILALGSVTTYFGIDGLDTYSYGIKSEAEIRKLQKHLFDEMKDGTDDEKHYVIVGAGPTGVELAGALGSYVRVLRQHFGIKKKTVHINLIEAAPRILPRLSESNSKRAKKRLRKLGIHIETNKKVEKQTAHALVVNGKPLSTQTVIWTSGVANPPFYNDNASHFTLNDRGKVVVDAFMQTQPHVYVIGDNAATPYAGLAQTALHDALYVAQRIKTGSKKMYKAKSPPCVVPIGHGWALFEWGWLRFGGWPGGLMHHAADFIGYNDILPISWAIGAWRSRSVPEMLIPDNIKE